MSWIKRIFGSTAKEKEDSGNSDPSGDITEVDPENEIEEYEEGESSEGFGLTERFKSIPDVIRETYRLAKSNTTKLDNLWKENTNQTSKINGIRDVLSNVNTDLLSLSGAIKNIDSRLKNMDKRQMTMNDKLDIILDIIRQNGSIFVRGFSVFLVFFVITFFVTLFMAYGQNNCLKCSAFILSMVQCFTNALILSACVSFIYIIIMILLSMERILSFLFVGAHKSIYFGTFGSIVILIFGSVKRYYEDDNGDFSSLVSFGYADIVFGFGVFLVTFVLINLVYVADGLLKKFNKLMK